MTKQELVDAVAEATGLKKMDAAKAVDAVFEAITDALASDDSVSIMGFGTFKVRSRAARQGRNPQTNEVITIAASKAPVFTAGKRLKDAIR